MSRLLEILAGLDDWIALDTETTGLGPYDVVIETAAIRADGELLLESLIRPERPVHQTASAVHGLRAADLESAPTWPLLWPRLQKRLRETTVVAWNASFDLRLLRQTCDRHDMPFQTPRALCLREIFKEQHPHVRGTLDAACLTLGLPIRPRHRARIDAEVARRAAWAMIEGQ